MTDWKKRIQFKDLLKDFDNDADELEEIARVKPIWRERFLSFKLPEFERFAEEVGGDSIKTLTQFGNFLNRVYDYCDEQKIWVE